MMFYDTLVSISAHLFIIAFACYIVGLFINLVIRESKAVIKLRNDRNQLHFQVIELQRRLEDKENYGK